MNVVRTVLLVFIISQLCLINAADQNWNQQLKIMMTGSLLEKTKLSVELNAKEQQLNFTHKQIIRIAHLYHHLIKNVGPEVRLSTLTAMNLKPSYEKLYPKKEQGHE